MKQSSCFLFILLIEIFLLDPAQDTDPKAIDDNLKDAVLSSFETNGKNVEVVFCFDTTGSMSQYLGSVSKAALIYVIR